MAPMILLNNEFLLKCERNKLLYGIELENRRNSDCASVAVVLNRGMLMVSLSTYVYHIRNWFDKDCSRRIDLCLATMYAYCVLCVYKYIYSTEFNWLRRICITIHYCYQCELLTNWCTQNQNGFRHCCCAMIWNQTAELQMWGLLLTLGDIVESKMEFIFAFKSHKSF